MASKNLSIRHAARRSGYGVGYISRVMNGKRHPSMRAAIKIAAAMHISVEQLQVEIVRRSAHPVLEEVSSRISRALIKKRGIEQDMGEVQ